MGWRERLIDAKIKTPDGNEYFFQYEDLSVSIEKNTSKHRFSDNLGTLVQDFGLAEKSFPLIIYFSGNDYDITANEFEVSAEKKGVCILTHPMRGEINVIIDKIDRTDALATGAGQAVFNLSMTETILTDIPATTAQLKTQTELKQETLLDANSTAFSLSWVAEKLQDATNAKNRLLSGIRAFKKSVGDIIKTAQEIENTVNEISDFIESNIDFLMTAPLELAGAIQRLYNAPSRCFASVQSRINGYLPAYNKLINTITGGNSQNTKNEIAEKVLIGNCILSSMSEVFINPDVEETGEYDYLTRSDAIKAAQQLKEYVVNLQESLDIDENATTDFSLQYKYSQDSLVASSLRDIINDSLKILISQSFDLKNEKIIVLDKDRTIVDLTFELYNTTDYDIIDFLCNSNNLTGEELVLIPKGKVIKYYV